jgi:hypothetical protein
VFALMARFIGGADYHEASTADARTGSRPSLPASFTTAPTPR